MGNRIQAGKRRGKKMKEYLGGRRINQNKRMYENVTRKSGI